MLKKLFRKLNFFCSNYREIPLYFFLIFIFGVLIILRYPNLILEPRFWGEERLYFETFLHANNWWVGFDALQYPAYYNFLSRFGGFLGSIVELNYAPLLTSLFGLFILMLPIIIIFFTNNKYWDGLKKKIVLSLFLIFSLSTGEIWLNSTNPHFIFPVVIFLILLDDNLISILKRRLYCFFIAIGAISGPFSLLMSPFFLYRFLKYRERTVFYYCLIFLVFGALHIIFFYISLIHGTGNPNRLGSGEISESLSLVSRISYLLQFNFIFPIFGYFISLVFRIFIELINYGVESIYFISILDSIPEATKNIFENVILAGNSLKHYLNLFISIIFGYIGYKIFKIADSFEKINFLGLFIYLSLVISILSIGGHGGFRYSYLTGFIILMFFYQKYLFFRMNDKFIKSAMLLKSLLVCSIVIGVIEYYPRMLSYTPDVISTVKVPWPNWKSEIELWKKDETYTPAVWPYIKNKDLIWPERSEVYTLNLNSSQNWEEEGEHRFSTSLIQILITDENEPNDGLVRKNVK